MTERALTAEQWARLPEAVRTGAAVPALTVAGGGGRGAGGFNAVALIDRMLVNPLPVLLELKDTLGLSAEQVTQIEAISGTLQTNLNRRREELGRRFDNVQGQQQQGRVFQEIQPEIERTRREVTDALRAVERIMTPAQWQQVPAQIRNPFQNQMMVPGGGGQRRGGGE
jgi:hypothetical protein